MTQYRAFRVLTSLDLLEIFYQSDLHFQSVNLLLIRFWFRRRSPVLLISGFNIARRFVLSNLRHYLRFAFESVFPQCLLCFSLFQATPYDLLSQG